MQDVVCLCVCAFFIFKYARRLCACFLFLVILSTTFSLSNKQELMLVFGILKVILFRLRRLFWEFRFEHWPKQQPVKKILNYWSPELAVSTYRFLVYRVHIVIFFFIHVNEIALNGWFVVRRIFGEWKYRQKITNRLNGRFFNESRVCGNSIYFFTMR